MSESTPDYIIAGAGTAGCVLARRLVERGASVLAIEAGGAYSRWLDVPLVSLKAWNAFADRWAWRFKTAPQPGLDGRRLDWPSALKLPLQIG